MTPDGVHGHERRAVLHEPADVDRVKAVDVLVGSRSRRTHGARRRRPSPPAAATAPGCRRARRCDSADRRPRAAPRATPSPAAARDRRAARPRPPTSACCARRCADAGSSPTSTMPEPGGRPARAVNAATAGPTSARICVRDRRAVEHPRRHQRAPPAASASSCFSDSGRPSTTSLSPGRIDVSGSGLNSIRPSCR